MAAWAYYVWVRPPDFVEPAGVFRTREGFFERWSTATGDWIPATGSGLTRYLEGDPTADGPVSAAVARKAIAKLPTPRAGFPTHPTDGSTWSRRG